jgi:hypothetical protein
MTKLSVSDSVTIVDPSNPEYQFAQEALRTYLKEMHATRRTEHAELDRLMDRVNAPMARIVSADSDASSALKELKSREIIQPANLLTGSHAPIRDHDLPGVFVIQPPYNPHGGFTGVSQGSYPAVSILNRPVDGYVGIDARSGHLASGADGDVNAYSGFGMTFIPRASGTLVAGFQIDSAHYSYSVGSYGIGGNATAQGTLEIGILNVMPPPIPPIPVIFASTQSWRKRVSGNETAQDSQSNLRLSAATNTFNVTVGQIYVMWASLYCFTDRSPGVGIAGAQSLGEGFVSSLWVV